jgi:serine/threonine protein kinase
MKVIIPENKAAPESLQLFAREASVLSQLHHPGIVQFQEFGLVSGRFFLAMEYVRTVSIQQILQSRTPEQQIRVCCQIICQVLKALVHAHAKSLVHRDIKPANILVSKMSGHTSTAACAPALGATKYASHSPSGVSIFTSLSLTSAAFAVRGSSMAAPTPAAAPCQSFGENTSLNRLRNDPGRTSDASGWNKDGSVSRTCRMTGASTLFGQYRHFVRPKVPGASERVRNCLVP